MTGFFLFIAVVCTLIAFCCIGKLVQLQYFSSTIQKEIRKTFENRVFGDRTLQWPDIHASYSNYNWSMPWNYNFSDMIVRDKNAA